MTERKQMTYRRVAEKIRVGGSEVRPIPATARHRRNGTERAMQRDGQERATFVPGAGERRAGKFPGLDQLKQRWERARSQA